MRNLKLPKPWRRGAPILARDLNLLREALVEVLALVRANAIVKSPDVMFRRSPGGTSLRLRHRPAGGGGGGGTVCALGNMTRSTDDEADPDDVVLAPGQIHAAGTHTPVGGEADVFAADVGDTVWAEVTITAVVEDDVFTGDWAASAQALDSGSTVPTDHAWTPASASGKAYAPLGTWADDGDGNPVWQGQSCGDVTFLWCADSPVTGNASFYRG